MWRLSWRLCGGGERVGWGWFGSGERGVGCYQGGGGDNKGRGRACTSLIQYIR